MVEEKPIEEKIEEEKVASGPGPTAQREEARPGIQDRFWAAIAYIWILCLVPFILKRGSRYVRYHAKQGVVLFIAEVILSVILIIPFIGILGLIGWILCIVFAIRGIFEGAKGSYWEVPCLGKYAQRLTI